MPIYEYQCQNCDERFEVMQRIADDPLSVCESCGGPLKKLISAPAFQFKGDGWYVTDYARKGDKGGKETGDAGDSDKGDSDKKDAKKDAKSSDGGDKKKADTSASKTTKSSD